MTTCPEVRVEPERQEVVFGPWPMFQGDYTAMKLADLADLVKKLKGIAF